MSHRPRAQRSMVALIQGRVLRCRSSSADTRDAQHPYLLRPAPILIPRLHDRASEIPRIVDEYAADAVSDLGASAADFTEADRTWMLDHAATMLREIETATLCLVAVRHAGGVVNRAAVQLRMKHASLRAGCSVDGSRSAAACGAGRASRRPRSGSRSCRS